ncbi:MAG: peptidase family protein [Ilumatobacteraceae bacterium]|nr:peptidase family protein [Ilumatobacteraceae bacterium]
MVAIPPERCIGGADLTEPRLSPDGEALAYARSAGGESMLMVSRFDGVPQRLTTSASPAPRTGRGLGGGCFAWTPASDAVVYVGADGNLWRHPLAGSDAVRITDLTPERAAQAPACSSAGDAVVYVVDQREVWCQPFDGTEARRLDDGSADFCFDPWVQPDGGVLWQAWNVPDMAWDASRICRISADGDRLTDIRPVGAVQQPRTMPDGRLVCVRDDTGWNNVWVGESPLVDEPFEHAGPSWGLGQRSIAVSDDGMRIAFTRNERGFGRLCVIDVATGEVLEIARGAHGQLSWAGHRLAALRTGARTPTQVVVYDSTTDATHTTTWERTVVDVGPSAEWADEVLAEPELLAVPARDGTAVHARLYRADAPTDRLMCFVHGGPTDQWMVTFMPRVAYWRAQGFNVLVVDHRGSTGHGRAYQQAMNGGWGVLDVADVVDVVEHAQRMGWGTAARTVMVGGSAGGFTVLGVVAAAPDIAAAAIASYPVTDLVDLAERSHRFERHYTHHLVGPIPAGRPTDGPYIDRSPVHFAARIRTPLLMLHGDADPVVPVEQSREMAANIAMAGGIVALVIYPGEGHGFRQRENQLDEYRRMGAFIAECFGEEGLIGEHARVG